MGEPFPHRLRVRYNECDFHSNGSRVGARPRIRFDDEFEVVARVVRLGDTSMITELVLEQGGEPAAEGELRHVLVASQDDLIEMKRAAGRDVDVADLNELAVMKGVGED